jgi:hypothetical protein
MIIRWTGADGTFYFAAAWGGKKNRSVENESLELLEYQNILMQIIIKRTVLTSKKHAH